MATVEFNRKYFFGLRRCDGLLLRYDIWERQTQGHAERKISITLSPTERASPTEANCSRSPARWRPATVLRLSRNSSILFTMLNVLLIILPLHLSLSYSQKTPILKLTSREIFKRKKTHQKRISRILRKIFCQERTVSIYFYLQGTTVDLKKRFLSIIFE